MPLCFSNVHRFLVFMTFSFWISVSVSVQAHLFFKAHYEQIYTGWCMKWNALKDFSINSSKFNFLTCSHRFKKKKTGNQNRLVWFAMHLDDFNFSKPKQFLFSVFCVTVHPPSYLLSSSLSFLSLLNLAMYFECRNVKQNRGLQV